jgi:hypothetical protein
MFLVPKKLLLKLKFRFKVKLLPAAVTELGPALIVHWLFETVPATPGVSAVVSIPVPASLSRYSRFVCG